MRTVRPGLDSAATWSRARGFPWQLDSARDARHYVAAALAGVDAATADDAAIVVTELATNALLHAGSAFIVTLSRSADSVRVAVADNDQDHGQPEVKPGHGLSVVTQLARAWGVDRRPGGKTVWAELAH